MTVPSHGRAPRWELSPHRWGHPCRCHRFAQPMLRTRRVPRKGPGDHPVSPAAGMRQPSLPGAGRVIFWGQGGCKGHCCPLLVQGQGERGQPGSHPGGCTRAGRDTAVPCCHMCAECARAQPGCHRLGKTKCGCSIPLAGKEPFRSLLSLT